MKVLITGGAGFIGAHVAQVLIARGDDVVLLDNFTDEVYSSEFKRQRLAALVPDFKDRLVEGSILDVPTVEQAFARGPFDALVHLAALANPGLSMDRAHDYMNVNVIGTVNVLEAAAKVKVGHVLFAGSSSVYNDEQTPFVETAYPLKPRSPYGASKAAAEQYAEMWHGVTGIPTVSARFFSVYGPWGRPDMAPMIFAWHILEGKNIQLSTGRQRDFTYIDDIVRGIVATLDAKLPGFEIMNIGRGEPVALDRLVDALETAAGKTVERTTRIAPLGEMSITFADTSKAQRLIGYQPHVSIEEGAAHLMHWLQTWKQGS